jgi:hypothetical protein
LKKIFRKKIAKHSIPAFFMFYICTRNDASATVGCGSAEAKQARLRICLARQLRRHSKDIVLLLRKKVILIWEKGRFSPRKQKEP